MTTINTSLLNAAAARASSHTPVRSNAQTSVVGLAAASTDVSGDIFGKARNNAGASGVLGTALAGKGRAASLFSTGTDTTASHLGSLLDLTI